MSNKNKTKAIQLPSAYALLEKPTATMAARKIVIDVDGKIHAFPNKDNTVPPEIVPDKVFLDMDDALKHPPTIEAYHEQYLGEIPKKQGIAVTAAYLWSFFCKEATPHLEGTRADGTKVRKSSNADRKYHVTDKTPPSVGINTRQAIVCYNILKDAMGKNKEVTESFLIAEVNRRKDEIKTRQDPWRIFQYYRPALVKAGCLKHD